VVDCNDFAQCLPSNHMRTIAALMQQQGIDITFATDETHGGIPYMVLLVQGPHTQQAHDLVTAFEELISKWRQAQLNEAERG
jgi:hypothetical protein